MKFCSQIPVRSSGAPTEPLDVVCDAGSATAAGDCANHNPPAATIAAALLDRYLFNSSFLIAGKAG
jgi:hypothetical protein